MLLALSEMCISGKVGAKIKIPRNDIRQQEYLFGEDQSRYLIEVNEKNKDEVSEILEKSNIYYEIIGKTQKDCLYLNEELNIKLTDLSKSNSFWFKNFFRED